MQEKLENKCSGTFNSFFLQKVLNWRSLAQIYYSAGKTMQSPLKDNNSLDTNFTFFIGFPSLHKCQMSFGTHFEIVEHNI